jgi:hypothetical protein
MSINHRLDVVPKGPAVTPRGLPYLGVAVCAEATRESGGPDWVTGTIGANPDIARPRGIGVGLGKRWRAYF